MREGACGVHWSGYDATSLDIEVDPQRCRFGSRKSDFALQVLVECRALEPKCFRLFVCVYYCSTYYKAVRVGGGGKQWRCVCLLLQDLVQSCLRGGGGILEDMCYERRRAEACVD